MTNKYKEAQGWLSHYFRGKTVYGGHPIEVIDDALEKASMFPELVEALEETVKLYGKEGGPWNVPNDAGGWLQRTREVIRKAKQIGQDDD